MLKHSIIATLTFLVLSTALVFPVYATGGHSGDDVPGHECDHGHHTNNPHCQTSTPTSTPTASPSPTASPTATAIPSVTPTVTPTATPPAFDIPGDPCEGVVGVDQHLFSRPEGWYNLPITLRDPDCGQWFDPMPVAHGNPVVVTPTATPAPSFTFIPLPAGGFRTDLPPVVSLPKTGN